MSGNYGLLDQIEATVFGESAGGIAVSRLAASPPAKGLFRGASEALRSLSS